MAERDLPDLDSDSVNISSCDVFVVNDVPHPRQSGGFYFQRTSAYMVYPTAPIVENQTVHLVFRTVPGAHHLDGLLFQSRTTQSFRTQNVRASQTFAERRSYQFSYRSFMSNRSRGTPRRANSLSGGEQSRPRLHSHRDCNRRSDHRFEPMPTRSGAKNNFTARQYRQSGPNNGESLEDGLSALNLTLQTPSQAPATFENPPHFSVPESPIDFAIPSTSQNQVVVKEEPIEEVEEDEDEEDEEVDGYDSL